jgi:hypothetical protein
MHIFHLLAHSVYYYFSVVVGIKPASPCFDKVTIMPNPGALKEVNASYPTKHKSIKVQLNFTTDKGNGKITLPQGITGDFILGDKKNHFERRRKFD